VAREIDALLADSTEIPRRTSQAPERPPHVARPPAVEEPDPIPEAPVAEPIVLSNAAETAHGILLRVLRDRERWRLEIDAKNYIAVTSEGSSSPVMITARADFRDDVWGSKHKTLRSLGWKTNDHGWVKGLGGGALLYATSGVGALALLSGTVRDYLMGCEAARSWPATNTKRSLTAIAEDLQRALEGI